MRQHLETTTATCLKTYFQSTKTVSEKEIIPKRHSSGKKDSEWMRDRVRGRGIKSET